MFSKLSQSIIYRKGLYGFNLLKTGILVVCVLAGEDAVTTCVSPRQTAGRPGPRLESGSGKLKAANLREEIGLHMLVRKYYLVLCR